MNFNLYCNCFNKEPPYENQKNQVNLMLGSYNYDDESRKKLISDGYILDDCGDNISQLNKFFGQSCGLYWTFKNSNEEFIGTSTYRIFWDNNFLENIELDENKLYVPNKIDVRNDQGLCYYNLLAHYSNSHHPKNYNLLDFFIKDNSILYKDFKNWDKQFYFYPFSMFIANKKVFHKICSILFETVLEKFYDYKYKVINYYDHTGTKRQMDFICERIVHLIIKNLDYYIPGIEVVEVPIIQYKHRNK